MLTLSKQMQALLEPFAKEFSKPTWNKVQLLVVGAILALGKRTITATLQIMGLSEAGNFSRYHHVLNRGKWSSLALSRILLKLLLERFKTENTLIFGIDETIERRKGKRIEQKGIYRDGVRSSHSYFVKVSGLRWVSLMWLTPISWTKRIWALPIMTLLAPSEGYHQTHHQRHKAVTDWARQMIIQLRRWLPNAELVIVADNNYATYPLLDRCCRLVKPVTMITRIRLDASLHEPVSVREPGTTGRPRIVGKRQAALTERLVNPLTVWKRQAVPWYHQPNRLIDITSGTAIWYNRGQPPVPVRWLLIRDVSGTFLPQALICTNTQLDPLTILSYFQRRWQMENTFQQVRAHLGVETQRQWSVPAIARTTPLLLGLFSWITLLADELRRGQPIPIFRRAWYPQKRWPTFSDALASVRAHLWLSQPFVISPIHPDLTLVSHIFLNRLLLALCYPT